MSSEEERMPITCPVCGGDDTIVSIQDLVERDEQDEVVYDSDFIDMVATTRNLTRLLKEPGQGCYVAVATMSCIFLYCVFEVFKSGYEVTLTILTVLSFLIIAAAMIKYIIDLRAWYRAKKRWGRLYYCRRDCLVFDHVTGKTCKPESMKQLLA